MLKPGFFAFFLLALVGTGVCAESAQARNLDPAKEQRLLTKRIENAKSVIAYVDACMAQANQGKLIILDEAGGCIVRSKDELAPWAMLRYMERAPEDSDPATYIAAAVQNAVRLSTRSIAALLGVRALMEKRIVDAQRRIAALQVPTRQPPPRTPTLSGTADTWTLVCCNNKYRIAVTLSVEGDHIEGSFGDGSAVTGTIRGSDVRFHRDMGGRGKQDYQMTLSADGHTMTGSFTGDRDMTVGVDTRMTR